MKKKQFNDKLVQLSDEIESKKQEIKEIKTKMAIESNELNVMGSEILKIEQKIQELTQTGKQEKGDKEGAGDKGESKNAQQHGRSEIGGTDPRQRFENQQLFDNLASYLSGQIIDDVNGDETLLLEI